MKRTLKEREEERKYQLNVLANPEHKFRTCYHEEPQTMDEGNTQRDVVILQINNQVTLYGNPQKIKKLAHEPRLVVLMDVSKYRDRPRIREDHRGRELLEQTVKRLSTVIDSRTTTTVEFDMTTEEDRELGVPCLEGYLLGYPAVYMGKDLINGTCLDFEDVLLHRCTSIDHSSLKTYVLSASLENDGRELFRFSVPSQLYNSNKKRFQNACDGLNLSYDISIITLNSVIL